MPLYVSYAVLQGLDTHSTFRALGNGHRERNPVMAPFAENLGGFLAVKAGAGVAAIALAEKLWPRNRAAALACMIALNAATAAVVWHNYSIGS